MRIENKKMKLNNKSLTVAGLISYVLIGLNILSGIVLGPLILRKVGDSVYGAYSTMMSVVNMLSIINVGVTQALARYIAVYNASDTAKTDIAGLCKIGKYFNRGIIVFVISVSAILFFGIPKMYSKTFSYSEIAISRKVFLILEISLILTILADYYAGIISGYGYFVFLNLTSVCRVAVKLCLSIALLFFTDNIFLISAVNVVSALLVLIAEAVFVKRHISLPIGKEIIKKSVLHEIVYYAFLVFVQAIFDQISSNVDSVMIGAMVGAVEVAVYSFGLSLFHTFSSLSTAISNMLLPTMAKKIERKVSNAELENTLINVGKIQFMIIGAALFGFISVGKLFIKIWLGNNYSDVYEIALVLMAGGSFHYIQNGAFSILRVKNQMGFGTIALVMMALFNVVTTYFMISGLGYKYAMVGTSLALVLYTIVMDVYYYKKFGINMVRVFLNTIQRIGPCNICAALFASFIIKKVNNDYLAIFTAILVYLFVYILLLFLFVLKKDEKKNVRGFWHDSG